jgi:hypothetical protein
VRVAFLPLVAELRDGPLLSVGDEDRIEAEALRASWFVRDAAFEHAGAADLVGRGTERHELADVPRPPAFSLDAVELAQQTLDMLPARETRRRDPRCAAQPVDLEPRILAEDPRRRIDRPPEVRLRPSVLVVGRPVLRRVFVGLQGLDRPAG